MQLLKGEKVKIIDRSVLHELFLQRLPSNVQMILASADMMTIDKLAAKIMDVYVGIPNISPFSTPTEGMHFWRIIREEVAVALQTQERSHPQFSANWKGGRNCSRWRSRSLGQLPGKQQVNQEGIWLVPSANWSIPENGTHHARRETSGPATSCDQHGWLTKGSPILSWIASPGYTSSSIPVPRRVLYLPLKPSGKIDKIHLAFSQQMIHQ